MTTWWRNLIKSPVRFTPGVQQAIDAEALRVIAAVIRANIEAVAEADRAAAATRQPVRRGMRLTGKLP